MFIVINHLTKNHSNYILNSSSKMELLYLQIYESIVLYRLVPYS